MELKLGLEHSLLLVDKLNPRHHGTGSEWLTKQSSFSHIEIDKYSQRIFSVGFIIKDLLHKVSIKKLQFKAGLQSF